MDGKLGDISVRQDNRKTRYDVSILGAKPLRKTKEVESWKKDPKTRELSID